MLPGSTSGRLEVEKVGALPPLPDCWPVRVPPGPDTEPGQGNRQRGSDVRGRGANVYTMPNEQTRGWDPQVMVVPRGTCLASFGTAGTNDHRPRNTHPTASSRACPPAWLIDYVTGHAPPAEALPPGVVKVPVVTVPGWPLTVLVAPPPSLAMPPLVPSGVLLVLPLPLVPLPRPTPLVEV